jgi:oligopeptide/dipeptide ABC transporter ATP-binding protein
MASKDKNDLIVVENLVKYFPIRGGVLQHVQGWVKAVDGISFTIKKGETLGLVGESGCGKTTVGRTMLGLTPADEGTVYFDGEDVLAGFASDKERNIQRSVWIALFTALCFLPYALGGPNILRQPGETIRIAWPVLGLITLTFVLSGLWRVAVTDKRVSALKTFLQRNAPAGGIGILLGLVWFNSASSILEGWGTSQLLSLFIPALVTFTIGWVIHSYCGKRIDKRVKRLRRNMQIVFQDPYSSLDPRLPVGESVGEGLLVHGVKSSQERFQAVLDTIETVGLKEFHIRRYPHEFSGGQRQRIGIARALALKPQFIVCDEPVSALDVSIQAQVLNILKDLQRKNHLSYLFIAHNLSVVEHISDRVAVMYLGKLVELADRETLFEKPLHPYTQALMSAISVPNPRLKRACPHLPSLALTCPHLPWRAVPGGGPLAPARSAGECQGAGSARGRAVPGECSRRERIILKGDVPSPTNPPSGCRFHPRCPVAMACCSQEEPEFKDIGDGHLVACWKVTCGAA